MAKTASVYDDIVVKLPVVILAGEDADNELDDDDPFEAGLNILVSIKISKQYFSELNISRLAKLVMEMMVENRMLVLLMMENQLRVKMLGR